MKKTFLLVGALVLLLCCSTSKDYEEADEYFDEETIDKETIIGLWTQYPDMPGTPRFGASSFTISNNQGSKGYLVGGYDMNAKAVTDVYVYNMDQYRWLSDESFPGIPRRYAVGTACNEKGYYGLGYYPDYDDGITLQTYNGTSYGDEISLYEETSGRLWDWWEFDPTAPEGSRWTRLQDFPGTARSGGNCFFHWKQNICGNR